jgi:hypothetical protein
LVCSRKSTHVCSLCNDEGKPGGREPWICCTKNGKLCYSEHMATSHSE